MARVTVEDCVKHVDSRFELVLIAAQRAKSIASGVPLTIDRDGEKDPVIALREIAKETVSPDTIREDLIASYQHNLDTDTLPDEELDDVSAEAAEEVESLGVKDYTGDHIIESEEQPVVSEETIDFSDEELDVND